MLTLFEFRVGNVYYPNHHRICLPVHLINNDFAKGLYGSNERVTYERFEVCGFVLIKTLTLASDFYLKRSHILKKQRRIHEAKIEEYYFLL